MTLGCRVFFREFLAEYEEEKTKTKWNEIYYEPSTWAAKMLGNRASRKKGDFGLIGRIGKRFDYEVQAEWRDIDQVWYCYLPLPENTDRKEIPWRLDVLIEHENKAVNIEYTILKFGEIPAPLKVGIFYPGKEEEKYLQIIRDMIFRETAFYSSAAYLIIFGFLGDEQGVYWHGYEIDLKGNVINLSK